MKLNSILFLILIVSACGRREKPAEEAAAGNETVEKIDLRTITDQTEPDTLKGSLEAGAVGKVGNTSLTINYYSPAVRGRIVWGGLVPFDRVWVTGAHMATNIEFDGAVRIGDKEIAPGKYALFTIPGKERWTIILNTNWEQHLADDYDAKLDVVRVEVAPVTGPHQERLQYAIRSGATNEGSIVIRWEKVLVELPLVVQ